MELLPRLAKYFVEGYENKKGQLVLPRFPPEMWSVHSRILADQPGTTNFLEGSHRGYAFKFVRDHPGNIYQSINLQSVVYCFIDFLHFGQAIAKDIQVIDKDVMLVAENKENVVQRKRRQVTL